MANNLQQFLSEVDELRKSERPTIVTIKNDGDNWNMVFIKLVAGIAQVGGKSVLLKNEQGQSVLPQYPKEVGSLLLAKSEFNFRDSELNKQLDLESLLNLISPK